jgi:hypothetical protein
MYHQRNFLSRDCGWRLARPSQTFNDVFQLLPDCAGQFAKLWVADGLHGRDRIDGRDLHPAAVKLLNDDVAGQHGPDLVFVLQRLMGEFRVAGAQDQVGVEIDVELLFQVALTSISVRMPKPSLSRAALARPTAASKSLSTILLK